MAKPLISAHFEAIGAGALEARFQVIEGKVRDVTKDAFRKATKLVKQTAKSLAPVGRPHRSKYPKLKSTIESKVGEKNNKVWGYVRAAFPALFQEKGTGQHHVGPYVRGGNPSYHGHKPQPFLLPAYKRHEAQIMRDMQGKI